MTYVKMPINNTAAFEVRFVEVNDNAIILCKLTHEVLLRAGLGVLPVGVR